MILLYINLKIFAIFLPQLQNVTDEGGLWLHDSEVFCFLFRYRTAFTEEHYNLFVIYYLWKITGNPQINYAGLNA